MKQNDASLHPVPDARWQLLGELELPVGSETNTKIKAWMTETLRQLKLHEELSNKIMNSAQDAAARAIRPEGVTMEFEYLHLFVLIPAAHKSTGQNWGFFRIEKIESAAKDKKFPGYTIEFYLYLEKR